MLSLVMIFRPESDGDVFGVEFWCKLGQKSSTKIEVSRNDPEVHHFDDNKSEKILDDSSI